MSILKFWMFAISPVRVEVVEFDRLMGYKNASLNGGYRESRAHEPHWTDKLPGGLTHKDDPIVMKVLEKVQSRSDAGMKKYGVSMARPDVTTVEWLKHAQEEALDLAVYLERCINDMS